MNVTWLPFEWIVAIRFLREGRMQTLFIISAVAIGVAVDTAYSACAGLLDEGAAHRVIAVLRALGLPTTHGLLADSDAVMAGLEEFREHLGGRLTITLLRGIGSPVDVHAMDAATLQRALAVASHAS